LPLKWERNSYFFLKINKRKKDKEQLRKTKEQKKPVHRSPQPLRESLSFSLCGLCLLLKDWGQKRFIYYLLKMKKMKPGLWTQKEKDKTEIQAQLNPLIEAQI
jgi:hypothetical protein